MQIVSFVLNLPWTLLGLVGSLLSIPTRLQLSRKPFAIIIHTRRLLSHDLEHELVHVEQGIREPLIHPALYALETWRHGYKDNKYEREAYARAGNKYLG
jgi:hypothetical protein